MAANPERGGGLRFPFNEWPKQQLTTEIAPGVLWMRISLPFRLDHVNTYLLEDGPGWTIIDTDIGNAETQALWEHVLSNLIGCRPIGRVIVTHCHPDHAGMAGWLCDRTGAQLYMSHSEYLTSLTTQLRPDILESEPYRSFYLNHGLAPDVTARLLGAGHDYLRMLTGLPRTFRRLIAGETIVIGGRHWQILTGGGHSPEQVMLYCSADRLFLAADQIMVRISPNISVQAMDPEGDPLGIYLRSLDHLRATVVDDALVLPGHHLPFYGLRQRADELLRHHDSRCMAILEACRRQGLTAAELVPVVFKRVIDNPHQMGFAFSEALAHINYLERGQHLKCESGKYLAS
jgi:glyoxylase-like metal-dependent hydrolase (beta-lactamase superfamily II)